MNLILAVPALLIGAIVGWSLRWKTIGSCRECGLPIGRTCIDCHDRRRAANLRRLRNQRHEMQAATP